MCSSILRNSEFRKCQINVFVLEYIGNVQTTKLFYATNEYSIRVKKGG